MTRPKLTYANVVGTLALFLLLSAGTVYAAGKLGKNTVKTGNIAKGAVKNPDLGAGAVNGAKIKDGSVSGGDVQDGTLAPGDATATIAAAITDAEITGRASAPGGQALNNPAPIPIALTGQTTFTTGADAVAAIAGEARFNAATTNPANQCSPEVVVSADGGVHGFEVSGTTASTTLTSQDDGKAVAPIGIINPGATRTLTAELQGDADCTATSSLGPIEIRILQVR